MFKVFKTTGIEGNYTISVNPLFINNNCWAIYPAKHKTTKKSYSVWQFQKKDWETKLTNEGIINKNNKKLVLNDIYDNIRLFIGNQAKLKHPNFLTVIEPLEDHKNRIMFVTEYVVNDLNNTDKSDLDEIMITKGLLQVSNGLKFLHESVQSVHLNINPASILITENCDWKICGLTFMENITKGIIEKYIDPIDSRLPSFLSIDFRFSSPNIIIHHKVDYINDLFSLCSIIYFLFNNGEYIIKCSQCSSITDYERQVNRLNNILQSIQTNSNKHAFFDKIPDNYYNVFINILQNSQQSNTDVIQLNKVVTINDMIESNIFNNELIKILNVIDEFNTLGVPEKISFLKKLKLEITKFPKPLLINKFIPILISSVDIDQFKKNSPQPSAETEELIIESCENLIILSKTLSQLTFTDKIYPFILLLMKKLQFDGFKILLLKSLPIIQNCLNASIENNSHNETFQKFTLDLFQKCVSEQTSMAVQELALINLKTLILFQPYSIITSEILPKICNIYSTTTSLKIKNLTLSSFIIMIAEVENNALDSFVIVDKILPLIYNTSSANYSNTKFTNNILKLYNCIFDKLCKSTNKTFNSKGTETELYDIMMQIGFNVWKIAKLITSKQDLNVAYTTWSKIEQYMKNDLDGKIVDNGSNQQINKISSPSLADSRTLPQSATLTQTPTLAPIPSVAPVQQIYKPIVSNTHQQNNLRANSNITNNYSKPFKTANSSNFDVMTPKNSLNLNKSKSNSMMTPTLKFGQTNTEIKRKNNTSISNSNSNSTNSTVGNDGGIDWSKATLPTTSYSVMTPNNKSDNSNISNTSINWNNSGSGMNSFGVMKPTTKNMKNVTNNNDDDNDDAWGDFAVGSTTKTVSETNNHADNLWGGSLI